MSRQFIVGTRDEQPIPPRKNTRRFWPLPCPAPAPKILTLAPPHPAPKEKKSAPSIPGGYQEKPKLYLFANDTRATPAGPFATKEGSIFSHQARHSTSCSSENRTLSTKSSTDLVLFIPASTLNYRAFLSTRIKCVNLYFVREVHVERWKHIFHFFKVHSRNISKPK